MAAVKPMPTTPPKGPRSHPRGTQTVKPLTLTPKRIRELHWKLDEIVRSNDRIPLQVIVRTIEDAFEYRSKPAAKPVLVRPKPARHRRSRRAAV